MNIRKIGSFFTDMVKGGFWFGRTFSRNFAERVEASPRAERIGGGLFDLAAGGGLTYLAATSIMGTVAGALGAAGALASAPVTAVATLAMSPVFLALSCITGGIGIGLLESARVKSGLISLPGSRGNRYGHTGDGFGQRLRQTPARIRQGFSRLTAKFKKAASPKQPTPPAGPKAPTPEKGRKFKI